MKITICGSLAFAKEILEVQKHIVVVLANTEKY